MKMKLSDKPTKWSESLDLTGNYLTGVAEVEGKKKKEKKEEKEEEKEEKEKEENELYGFGVNIHTAPAPYWRTKIVTIKPHILFVNLTSFPLLCSQSIGFSSLSSSSPTPAFPITTLSPGEEKVFHWSFKPLKDSLQKLLQVSLLTGTNVDIGASGSNVDTTSWDWSWSSGIPILDGSTRFEVKIRRFGTMSNRVRSYGREEEEEEEEEETNGKEEEEGKENGKKKKKGQKMLDFDEYFMVCVTASISGSTVVVEFTHQKDQKIYEYVLENRTEKDVIRVRQKDLPLLEEKKRPAARAQASGISGLMGSQSMAIMEEFFDKDRRDIFDYVIPPGYSVPFFKDDFRGSAKEEIEFSVIQTGGEKIIEVTHSSLSLKKLKKYDSIKVLDHKVYPMVVAQGPTKKIIFATSKNVPDLDEPTDQKDQKQLQQHQQSSSSSSLKFSLILYGIGISVLDDIPEELMYLSISALKFSYSLSPSDMSVELKIGRMQIDNQVFNTPFPIVLFPVLSKVEGSETDFEPFLHFTAVKSTLKEHQGIDYYRYIGFRISKIDVEVDEIFLLKALSFVVEINKFLSEEATKGTADALVTDRANFLDKELTKALQLREEREKKIGVAKEADVMVYSEWIQINAMVVCVSFLSTPWREMTQGTDSNVIELMVHYLGSFSNLEAAPIKLNALYIQRPFCTMSNLQNTIIQHYIRQGLSEWYKIIGSAAVLGSPVTLVDRLGTGFYDFFHEPALGFVAGPEQFGKGLAKGTQSLIKNTLSGLFGSASKFTDAVSGGLVKVGMDDDWERERRIAALKKPKHLGEGLQQGFMGLGEGVFKGVTGVVMQPVKGFQEEGALGLVKGLGKGTAGLVLRPAVGVVDVFTRTAEGMENMGKFIGGDGRRVRIRPPRSVGNNQDKLLKPFTWGQAALDTVAREMEDGKYAKVGWNYRFSLFPVPLDDLQWMTIDLEKIRGSWLFISPDRILLCAGSVDAARQTLDCKWNKQMESIVKFTRSSKGINVVLRKESEEIIVSKEMVEKILVALKACQSVKGKSHGGKRKSVLRKGMLEKKDPVISRKSYQPIGSEEGDEETPLLGSKRTKKKSSCSCCDDDSEECCSFCVIL
eukprot:CAMPEP_0201501974 /NCGR_PEP_ID=MMETSP0151_2-20130828/83881_1 /ASSEMBLY_ACC=CAM_ASM_000257 /TAXON_ID=200890 /ORGANISM="Paramoeba atlantica, Strain 621/1 / CCAP 1560/9" /LENGTH=1102 /DNA_ID=CAMNT_0047895529 /DNA_START=905 /DNA_END=4213 /DNA_ORIENTATION=-